MVSFGTKATREVIEDKGKGGEVPQGLNIWSVRPGSTILRFLDDLGQDEWTSYWEHYDQGAKKYFPCAGKNNDCPGCEQDMKASKRYLTNAYLVSSDNPKVKAGYVNLYKIPASMMEKLMRRSDRAGGTIVDRDYEVIRTGNGIDTEYDLETGDKYEFDFEKYADKLVDHEEALQAAWAAYTGDGAEASEPESEPAPRVRPRAKTAEEVEDERRPVKERVQDKLKDEPSDLEKAAAGEDPPTEPQVQSASADAEGDEDEVLSEEAVRAMSVEGLQALHEQCGLTFDGRWGQERLADNLIEKLGE